jgi:hypothetical protein
MLGKHFTAIVVVGCLATAATAQTVNSYDGQASAHVMPGIWMYPHGCWPSYSSTYQEGVLRGWGELWRGYGESIRSQAQGAVYAEQARAMSLENRRQQVTQYFELRELNRKHRFGRRGVSQASTGAAASSVAHKQKTTKRASQLSGTGHVDWPLVLQGEQCGAARKQVEAAMARRAAGAQFRRGTAEYSQVRLAIDELLGDLKSRVSDMPATDYITAKSLLVELRSEITRSQPVQLTQN